MAFLVNLEELVERDHPLREVKRMCKEVLDSLEGELAQMYAQSGRPSVPPERLLMA
jgi:transposase